MVYIAAILLYILASMIAGHFGRKRRIGYWGWLFLSILITPLIALLFLFLSSPKADPEPVDG